MQKLELSCIAVENVKGGSHVENYLAASHAIKYWSVQYDLALPYIYGIYWILYI